MAAPNTFSLPAETVASWASRLAGWRGQKSVDEVLREIEGAAQKPGADGKVSLTRHQLWTWAESLQGLSAKLPLAGADAARSLAAEIRGILSGGAAPAPAPSTPPPASAVVTGLSWEAPRPTTTYTPPPPVTYVRPAAAASGGEPTRFVGTQDLGATVQGLLRGARQEVLVLSPWRGGADTLLHDLMALPQAVAVRLITRAPQPDDPAYHRAMADLRRKGVDLAASPYVHTRMVLVDGQTLLLGAASLPGPSTAYSREVALLTTDPKAVNEARIHFANVQREARGSV